MAYIGVTTQYSSGLAAQGTKSTRPKSDDRSVSDDAHPEATPAVASMQPSVDSAVDMSSPSTLTPVHQLASLSPKMTAAASVFGEGGSSNHDVSRSVSFTTEYRDSSFDGEPDIPESVRQGELPD